MDDTWNGPESMPAEILANSCEWTKKERNELCQQTKDGTRCSRVRALQRVASPVQTRIILTKRQTQIITEQSRVQSKRRKTKLILNSQISIRTTEREKLRRKWRKLVRRSTDTVVPPPQIASQGWEKTEFKTQNETRDLQRKNATEKRNT